MKLDEFKKLEELRLSSLIGDYGSAALKKMKEEEEKRPSSPPRSPLAVCTSPLCRT